MNSLFSMWLGERLSIWRRGIPRYGGLESQMYRRISRSQITGALISKWAFIHFRTLHFRLQAMKSNTVVRDSTSWDRAKYWESDIRKGIRFKPIHGHQRCFQLWFISDNLWRGKIAGIDRLLINWILQMLEWRQIHMLYRQQSIAAECLRGSKRGPLSSLFWT